MATIGLDIGKHASHLVEQQTQGKRVLKQQILFGQHTRTRPGPSLHRKPGRPSCSRMGNILPPSLPVPSAHGPSLNRSTCNGSSSKRASPPYSPRQIYRGSLDGTLHTMARPSVSVQRSHLFSGLVRRIDFEAGAIRRCGYWTRRGDFRGYFSARPMVQAH